MRESATSTTTIAATAVYNISSPPTAGIDWSTQPTETECDYIDTEIAAETSSSVTIRCESNEKDFTVHAQIHTKQEFNKCFH